MFTLKEGELLKTCKECKKEFLLTVEDQEWFKKQGYVLPSRCGHCRWLRRQTKNVEVVK